MGSALVLAVCAAPAFAQPADNGNNNNQQQGRRNFDPAQMRQMIMDNLKQALGASDEEMQALAPKIEKVMQIQRDASPSMRGLFRRGDRGPQPQSDQPLSSVQQKTKELKEAIDNNAPASDIKAKMQALRDARAAARQELAKAQAELKELVTPKQEGVLLMFGMLE